MAEILDAAWGLCRERGLNALTMRALGDVVGMRAQSIYAYFESKDAIYDAMFAAGNTAFLDWIDRVEAMLDHDDPGAAASTMIASYLEFCVTDPTRFELLFHRTIPGFVPSEASFAIAEEALSRLQRELAALGVHGESDVDLWTATATGLASQQIANDPGGDRWSGLAQRAARMLLDATTDHRTREGN